jgi:DNA-binding NarL/FixJ family response regulator
METGEKILVVDDNNVLLIVVAKMPSLLGYEVSSADSGANGLSAFRKRNFDIVLSDYDMPGMDGAAFACSVKKCSSARLYSRIWPTRQLLSLGAGRRSDDSFEARQVGNSKDSLTGDDNMNAVKIAAIVLIIAGALGLAYGSFSFTKETHEAKLGPIELSVKEKQTVNVPVWAGVGAIVIGGGLLFFGSKKS